MTAEAMSEAFDTAWPLAASTEFDRLPTAWRTELADRLERQLQRHVVQAWYPRTVDLGHGGFQTDFDRHWRPTGPDDRMLEYQARQTRSVARLGQAFPDQAEWKEWARHGTRYIDEVMHDAAEAGWFWLVNRAGEPLAGGTKHAHSTAYVIGAMSEAYMLTSDARALELAQSAFDWLDATLHDDEHGGYHGWATRDGQPILRREQVAHLGREVDPLGHKIGLKDLNVHSDLVESLRLLYALKPSDKLRSRTTELYDMVNNNFMAADGRMYYLLHPDLSHVEGPEHPGYAFQCAFRMPLLAPFVGRERDVAFANAQRQVEYALRSGRADGKAGLVEKLAPARERLRTWWVQTEVIQALVLLEVNGIGRSFRPEIEEFTSLVEAEMLDERYGGWHQLPRSDWSFVDKVRARRLPKAHRWKDSSHETDMYLSAIRMLRGLRAAAPIHD